MGAPSKALYGMLIICVVVIVSELAIWGNGTLYLVLFQIMVLVLGVPLVWKYGTEGIIKAATRLRDATQIWDEPSAPKLRQRGDQSIPRDVYCMYCGYALPDDATFCRRCGKPQRQSKGGTRRARTTEQKYLK